MLENPLAKQDQTISQALKGKIEDGFGQNFLEVEIYTKGRVAHCRGGGDLFHTRGYFRFTPQLGLLSMIKIKGTLSL